MKKERPKITAASYLMLIKENKILLLRRFNTGYEDGNYSMVAGHIDKGETFTQCIVREAWEEAGIVLMPEDIHVCHVMQRNSLPAEENERVDAFFIAEKWSGNITNKESNKCDDLSWFPLDNLPGNTIEYIRVAIENYKNKIFYSEFGW